MSTRLPDGVTVLLGATGEPATPEEGATFGAVAAEWLAKNVRRLDLPLAIDIPVRLNWGRSPADRAALLALNELHGYAGGHVPDDVRPTEAHKGATRTLARGRTVRLLVTAIRADGRMRIELVPDPDGEVWQ